mmetsp:Transcript_37079/g.96130  ORF Transcript_37079/g.96130 Transcript_37079/m.96130 type:complete len:283 (-) Transcript_37079:1192-2040(-)
MNHRSRHTFFLPPCLVSHPCFCGRVKVFTPLELFFPPSSPSSSFSLISFSLIRSYTFSKNSCGKFSPSLQPLLLLINCCFVIFLSGGMEGLCASVLSMITLNASVYAASSLLKIPGLFFTYFLANLSTMRSIFCASPGSQKEERKNLSASSKPISSKFSASIKASSTRIWFSFSPPKYSPICFLSSPFVSFNALAMLSAVPLMIFLSIISSMPFVGFSLKSSTAFVKLASFSDSAPSEAATLSIDLLLASMATASTSYWSDQVRGRNSSLHSPLSQNWSKNC